MRIRQPSLRVSDRTWRGSERKHGNTMIARFVLNGIDKFLDRFGALFADALTFVGENHDELVIGRPEPMQTRDGQNHGGDHKASDAEGGDALRFRKVGQTDAVKNVDNKYCWNDEQQ